MKTLKTPSRRITKLAIGIGAGLALISVWLKESAISIDFQTNYIVAMVAAVVLIALLAYPRTALVAAIILLAAGANLPSDLAAEWSLDPRVLLYALAVLVATVALNRFFRALPTGLEPAPGAPGTHGTRALHYAARRGRLSLVEALVEQGVDCDARDEEGRTPLMVAAAAGQEAVVKRLLRAGARVNITDTVGDTALDLALRAGDERIATLVASGIATGAVATSGG